MSLSVVAVADKLTQFASKAAQETINKWKGECFDRLCEYEGELTVDLEIEIPEEFDNENAKRIIKLLTDDTLAIKCDSLNGFTKVKFTHSCSFIDNTLLIEFGCEETLE